MVLELKLIYLSLTIYFTKETMKYCWCNGQSNSMVIIMNGIFVVLLLLNSPNLFSRDYILLSQFFLNNFKKSLYCINEIICAQGLNYLFTCLSMLYGFHIGVNSNLNEGMKHLWWVKNCTILAFHTNKILK